YNKHIVWSSDNDPKPSDTSKRDGSINRPSSPRNVTLVPHIPSGLSTVIRVVLYVVLGLAGLWFLLKFLANFTHWAQWLVNLLRDFWQGLFGGGAQGAEADAADDEAEEARPAPRPFASYRNPFHAG